MCFGKALCVTYINIEEKGLIYIENEIKKLLLKGL
jgi:hypothetical protein